MVSGQGGMAGLGECDEAFVCVSQDLPDAGAGHFALTVREIKIRYKQTQPLYQGISQGGGG